MNVAESLRALMAERGWTMYQLAKESGVSWSTIRNFYKKNTEPSVTTLQYLCEGLGITLAQFFDCDGELSFTAEQSSLLKRWDRLTPEERHAINETMNLFLKHHENAEAEKEGQT